VLVLIYLRFEPLLEPLKSAVFRLSFESSLLKVNFVSLLHWFSRLQRGCSSEGMFGASVGVALSSVKQRKCRSGACRC